MDPSKASINANQPEQTETIICMDLKYYNAAAEGKIEVFKDIIDHQSLDCLLTPIKNTVLHIYITALNSKSKSTTSNVGSESTATPNAGSKSTTNFVKEILKMCPSLLWKANARSESTTTLSVGLKLTTNFVEEILKMCPSLLWKANDKDETPLHIAARYGHYNIVEVLIKYCARTLHQDLEDRIEPVKKMFRMRNKQGDTALHEAARYNHPKVVELLIREDPNFSYPANDADETPLFIAVERRFKSVVFKILDKCKLPMYGGPLGRTALHAAVIQNDKDMTSKILEKIEAISRKVDNNGWTPLHLAAYFNRSDLAKLLLNRDREVAYMKDPKGRTALHIAAQRGKVDALSCIVSSCPDCCELVDNRGWNVLHFAMKAEYNRLEDMIKIIIKNSSLSNLLNEKNVDGDTPLHYYANSSKSAYDFLNHPRVDRMAFNKQNLSVVDIILTDAAELPSGKKWGLMKAIDLRTRRVITYEDEDQKNKDEDERNKDEDKKNEFNISMLQKAAEAFLEMVKEKKKEEKSSRLQKAAETQLVVAALITTVTFAACITMPGGFAGGGEGSHPGSALLRRNAAFKAFVIMDTISMAFSSTAVILHLIMPALVKKNYDAKKREEILRQTLIYIYDAMIAMVLAFVTGTYAVLEPSFGLAITNLIIGLTFFFCLHFGFDETSVLDYLPIFPPSSTPEEEY